MRNRTTGSYGMACRSEKVEKIALEEGGEERKNSGTLCHRNPAGKRGNTVHGNTQTKGGS